MELYSAGTGNGMRADCIFGVLDYDERPLSARSRHRPGFLNNTDQLTAM